MTRQQIGLRNMALIGLIVGSTTWLLILVMLVLDFACIWPRQISWRWQGTGMLVNGAVLVDVFTEFRHWPYSRLGTVHSITLPTALAGFVIFGVGLVIRVRGAMQGPAC